MNNWTPLLTDPHLIQALGYTVLHSLWQGALVALLYGLWLKYSVADNEKRYSLGLFSLLSILAMSALTFMIYFGVNRPLQDVAVASPGDMYEVTQVVGMIMENPSRLIDYMPIISNVWIIGLLIYSLRLVFGGLYTIYLRNTAITLNDSRLKKRVKRLSSKMEIDKLVSIVGTTLSKSPMMIGHLKPIILMPMSLLSALTPDEIEAIISHELAHIKRNDYLINILQTMVEVLYYYHPAVYFISEQIRAEREHCCDDIAIKYTQNSLDYAKLLVKLQEIQVASQVSLAMHFKHSNQIFMNRIKRLLHIPKNTSSQKNRVAMLVIMVLMLLGVQHSAHSISKSIDDRLVDPISKLDVLVKNNVSPLHTPIIEIDTTPIVKKIITKKTITIIDGDSTISETTTEVEGEDDGNLFFFKNLGDNDVMWLHDDMDGWKLHLDSLKDGLNVFEDSDYLNIYMDSLGKGLSKMQMYFNGADGFHFDTLFNGNSFNYMIDSLFGKIDMNWDSLMNNGSIRYFDGSNNDWFNFDFDNLRGAGKLKELYRHNFPDNSWAHSNYEGRTPADKLNRALNRDGLLEINQNNKVELSGKDLKINGDKQPKNIHSKYKRLWEDASGTVMNKDDKVTLELKGKEYKRTMRSY